MPTCPICGWWTEKENYRETYVSSFNSQEYKLYHCDSCELEWWEPLKIIPEFYEQEGDEGYAVFHLGLREEVGENHRMFFKMIPVKSGRLLDVGCGDGVFLKEAKKAGYEVWGIDFDAKSIKVCQEKWGLKNTFAMSPFEFAEFCEKEGLKFDIITFFEVLEHQDRPREFLDVIKSMLKPGGWTAGSVPNRESWHTKKLLRDVQQVDFPPNHFLRFSSNVLANCLHSLGYYNANVSEVPQRIKDITANLSLIIFKDTVTRKLRKNIIGCEYGGEMTSVYKNASFIRKSVFKGLKMIRDLIFLTPAILMKLTAKGPQLYFQAQKPV